MSDPMRFANYDAWKLATPEVDEEPEAELEWCENCAGIGWAPLFADPPFVHAECQLCGGSGFVE